jgi:CRP/FNR family transcriptional regulator, cyclic AMP receptor protein
VTIPASAVAHVGLLQVLPGAELDLLLSRARRLQFGAGTYVYHAGQPGDSMYILLKGRVAALAGGERGEQLLVNIIGAGEVFGELGMLTRAHTRTAAIQALTPIDTLALMRSDVEELRMSHPRVNDVLLTVLAERLEHLTVMTMEIVGLDASTRIHRQLLRLADVFEVSGPGAVLPVSQPQLASVSGVGLRITSRVVTEAKAAGRLATGKRQITILDWDGVRRSAGWRFVTDQRPVFSSAIV